MSAECSIKVQMFSGACGVSIRDSEINNVGGDLTINNYIVHFLPDSEPVQVPLLSKAIPFFRIKLSRNPPFHVKPQGFYPTTSETWGATRNHWWLMVKIFEVRLPTWAFRQPDRPFPRLMCCATHRYHSTSLAIPVPIKWLNLSFKNPNGWRCASASFRFLSSFLTHFRWSNHAWACGHSQRRFRKEVKENSQKSEIGCSAHLIPMRFHSRYGSTWVLHSM